MGGEDGERMREKVRVIEAAIAAGEKTRASVFRGDSGLIPTGHAKCPACNHSSFGWDDASSTYKCTKVGCGYQDRETMGLPKLMELNQHADEHELISGAREPRDGLRELDTYNILALRVGQSP